MYFHEGDIYLFESAHAHAVCVLPCPVKSEKMASALFR